MRVTQSISNRLYLRNLHNSQTNMLSSYNKVMTQMAYTRVSQDSINASKAMTTRRQLKNLDMYDDNLKTAKDIFKAAETNLLTIAEENYKDINVKVNAAINGTYDYADRSVFANELRQYGEEIVSLLNSDFAERQLFGGTSNGSTPFTVQAVKVEDSAGNIIFDSGDKKLVCYNGVPLNLDATAPDSVTNTAIGTAIGYNSAVDYSALSNGNYKLTYDNDASTSKTLTLNFEDARSSNDNSKLYPGGNPIYIDVGMGIKYDSNYNVDPQTAMDISLNGAELTGSGVDYIGMSKNLAQLVFDIADALDESNLSFVAAGIDRIAGARNTMLNSITKLGAKQNSIEFYEDKNDSYRFNLLERQNDVEGVDLESEIVNYESLKAAYDAALKMNARLIPTSIFDFI